jgi:hypothetical protein
LPVMLPSWLFVLVLETFKYGVRVRKIHGRRGILSKKDAAFGNAASFFTLPESSRQRYLSIEANRQGHGKPRLNHRAADVTAAGIHHMGTDCRGDTDRYGAMIGPVMTDLVTDGTVMMAVVRFGAINPVARTVLHPVDAVHFFAGDETVLPGMLFGNLNSTLILAEIPEFVPVYGAGSNPLADPFLLFRLTLTDGSGSEGCSAQQE